MDLMDLMISFSISVPGDGELQVISRKGIPRTHIRHRDILLKDILRRDIHHNRDILRRTRLSTPRHSLLHNSKAAALELACWKDVWLLCAVAASWRPAFDGVNLL
ncbi:hypothetical protein SLE2022_156360 [Rubroshorea leprosula]